MVASGRWEKLAEVTRMAPLLRAAFLLWVIAGLAAIWIQDHSGALPLGLFNDGRREYDWLSAASLVLMLAMAALFLVEMLRRKPSPLAGALRGLIASFLLLELLLFAVDVTLVSRGPSSRLGGPYRELESASDGWLWLKKATPGRPMAFGPAPPTQSGRTACAFSSSGTPTPRGVAAPLRATTRRWRRERFRSGSEHPSRP